jgi:branched-chain amino acid transport system substrate-binding protein
MRHSALALLVAALTLASVGLLAQDAAAQPTLRLGEITGLTGPISYLGVSAHNARLIAVDEINAKGGVVVGGVRYKIELVHLDASKSAEVVTVFERLLTQSKVNLIVDGLYASGQYALAPVLKGKNAIVLWTGGNDPGTTVGIPNAFRNAFDGGEPFTKVNELFLKKMGIRRIAAYGQTGHAEFKQFVEQFLPKLGFEMVATEWHPSGEKDFFPILTKLKNLKPDAVITHGFYNDVLNMMRQAREIGLFPGPLWLNQCVASPLVMDEPSRKVFEGSYETLIDSWAVTSAPPAKSAELFQKYVRRFGERGFGAYAEDAYDSVYIMAKAVEKAGTIDDIPKIIAAMRAIAIDEIPELTHNYKPGKLFDENGQAYPEIVFAQWKDQKLVPAFSHHGK